MRDWRKEADEIWYMPHDCRCDVEGLQVSEMLEEIERLRSALREAYESINDVPVLIGVDLASGPDITVWWCPKCFENNIGSELVCTACDYEVPRRIPAALTAELVTTTIIHSPALQKIISVTKYRITTKARANELPIRTTSVRNQALCKMQKNKTDN